MHARDFNCVMRCDHQHILVYQRILAFNSAPPISGDVFAPYTRIYSRQTHGLNCWRWDAVSYYTFTL